jgi:molecular chaperone DnaK
LLDARNEADSVTWQIEKMLRDAGNKISDADKAPIQAAIDKVRRAAQGEDAAAIKQAVNELTQSAQAMAQHLQSQGAASGASPNGAAGGAGGTKGGDDVIDADFEVKK